ncbi:MAG: PilZ domain-containing protein [Hyphomicrobiales bacterium]
MDSFERRLHGRKPFSGSVFFASTKRIYEGALLNYSRSGLAVRVSERFVGGELLIVALPFENAVPPKCKARVVWCNGKEFGAKFVR